MKLKNKIAKRLRKLADKLDPAFTPDFLNSYALLGFSSDRIETIRIKKTYAARMCNEYQNFDEYARRDMVHDIAQTLATSRALTLSKNVVGNVIEYHGQLKFIMSND